MSVTGVNGLEDMATGETDAEGPDRELPSKHPPTAASRNQVAKTVNPEGRPSPRRRLEELRRVKQRIQATFGDINVGLLLALRHLVDTIWTATSESARGAL
jgi:hypothetical protein